MVCCKDGSLYVGITQDVEKRVQRHNWGVATEFTAERRPVALIWSERCSDAGAARKRERELKGWSRNKKLLLVEQQRKSNPSASPQGKGE